MANDADSKIFKLRSALIGLVGAETKDELERMEDLIRSYFPSGPQAEASINAIHALLETA